MNWKQRQQRAKRKEVAGLPKGIPLTRAQELENQRKHLEKLAKAERRKNATQNE